MNRLTFPRTELTKLTGLTKPMELMKRTRLNRLAALLGIALAAIAGGAQPAFAEDDGKSEEKKITYEDHVKPILRQRCSSCHNPSDQNAGLDVTSYIKLMEGGASGAVIERGDADVSYLYALITHQERPYMPPSGDQIPDEEIATIGAWIRGGALENKSSKAVVKKNKVDMTLAENPTARPEVPPLPARTVLEPVIYPEHPPNADAIATSPWAPIVAIGGQRQVLLYNTKTFDLRGVIPFEEGKVNALRFSRNGQLLLIGGGHPGKSGKVVVWNVLESEVVTTVGDELDSVLACDISPDQSMVALGGPEKIVKVYSTETGEILYELTKHTEWITAIEFSPQGALLITGDRNGGLHTWEAMTGREYMTLKGHSDSITSVSWRSDSNLVASGSEDSTIRLWELNNGRQIKSWNAHGGGTLSIEFARDGRIVSAGRDNLVKVWNQQGKQLKAFPKMPDIATHVSFCDETNQAIGGAYGGQVSVWKFEDAKVAADLTTKPAPLAERVKLADQQLASVNSKLEQAKKAKAAAQQAHDQTQKELSALREKRHTAEVEVEKWVAEVESSNQQKSQATSQLQSVTPQLKRSKEALPLLQESLNNLQAAAGKLGDDAKLKQSAAQLEGRVSQLQTEIGELESQATAANSQLNAAEQAVNETSQKIKTRRAQISKFDKQIADLEAKLAPQEQKLDEAVAEFNRVKKQQEAAAAQVAYWKGEIEFKERIAELEARLEDAQKMQASRAAELEEAEAQLAKLQAKVEEAREAMSRAEEETTLIRQELDDARHNRP